MEFKECNKHCKTCTPCTEWKAPAFHYGAQCEMCVSDHFDCYDGIGYDGGD